MAGLFALLLQLCVALQNCFRGRDAIAGRGLVDDLAIRAIVCSGLGFSHYFSAVLPSPAIVAMLTGSAYLH